MAKIGGWAGIGAALTYLVGFVLAGTLLVETVGMNAADYVGFLADNEAIMYVWTLIIYVLNGALLVALSIALYDRLRAGAADLARIATAFGLIWAGLVIATGMLRLTNLGLITSLQGTDLAAAASLWPALEAVEEGLGGGVELPGGLWVLLVSWAALRTHSLPRSLTAIGMSTGLAGILTLVPGVEAFEAIFGLGLMVWFAWVGIILLRSLPTVAERSPFPATQASPAPVVGSPASLNQI